MSLENQLQGRSAAAATLECRLAASLAEVEAAQRLRYEVFGREGGALLRGRPGLDEDRFDPFCDHLLVWDRRSGEVVASTRLLSDVAAVRAGGYYAESEFDINAILALPGRIAELGRTCVDRRFRNGATIAVLWSGVAAYVRARGFDYLMGCASLDLSDGGFAAWTIAQQLRRTSQAPAHLRVVSKCPCPEPTYPRDNEPPRTPPLLKAYMRLGAWVCSDLAHDPAFGCADLFVLLDAKRLTARYARHFLTRASQEPLRSSPAAHLS